MAVTKQKTPAAAVAAPAAAAAPAAVAAPAPAEAKVKVAAAKTGDEIVDVASEIEQLSKVKALNLAQKLVEEQGSNDFKLGGVFLKIKEQGWYDGHESFEAFVSKVFGFATRKAYYLMDIYKSLTEHNISWDKVKDIGWTKLARLAPVLTSDNVDEWVAKAKASTVLELEAILKAGTTSEEGTTSVTGSSDVVTFKLKAKKDQVDTYMNAIAKAKAEVATEHDAVGLETICAGYLGGTVSAAAGTSKTLKELIAEAGWQAALEQFGEVFPGVDLSVTAVAADPTKPAPAAPAAVPAA